MWKANLAMSLRPLCDCVNIFILKQEDLDNLRHEWNRHRIAPSRNQLGPFGRPNIMYSSPELYQTRNYLNEVQLDEIEVCEEECVFKDDYTCDPDIFDLSCIEMAENNLEVPRNAIEAMMLYEHLRNLMLLRL